MNTLTRKWHGVPLWALALAGLTVAYFGYHYFKIRSANAADNSAGQTQSNLLQPARAGGAGGAGSLTVPGMVTAGNTDAPPFTSPSPAAVNSPSQSFAVAPLDSAPITDTGVAPAPADPSTAVAPFDPALAVPSASYYALPSKDDATVTYLPAPVGWFQNEGGLQKVTTPPQLAPGQIPVPGTAYAS